MNLLAGPRMERAAPDRMLFAIGMPLVPGESRASIWGFTVPVKLECVSRPSARGDAGSSGICLFHEENRIAVARL